MAYDGIKLKNDLDSSLSDVCLSVLWSVTFSQAKEMLYESYFVFKSHDKCVIKHTLFIKSVFYSLLTEWK